MNLCVWDSAGSPLFVAASSLEQQEIEIVPLEWGRSRIALRFGGGESRLDVDDMARGSAVLLGPWLDLNPEVLAGPLDEDLEYALGERLALLGSAQHFLRRQCRVLNPIWRWTGSISIQETGEQRRLLREAGFVVVPEIVGNDGDGLRAWGELAAARRTEATPGQLAGVDGLLPRAEELEKGAPFIPRRYLARRPSENIRVVTSLLGRTFDVPLSEDGEGGAASEAAELDPASGTARRATALARLLETEICEILLEGDGDAMQALAFSRTLGLLTPPSQLPNLLRQITTVLSEESR